MSPPRLLGVVAEFARISGFRSFHGSTEFIRIRLPVVSNLRTNLQDAHIMVKRRNERASELSPKASEGVSLPCCLEFPRLHVGSRAPKTENQVWSPHMKRLRFVMIGGFLGAGKTTTMARLARTYQDTGQAQSGWSPTIRPRTWWTRPACGPRVFPSRKWPGRASAAGSTIWSQRVGQLQEHERPDVILAEPVGSCTDLVATVVQPLRDLYGDRFQVAPFPVLFKPSHGLRILRNEPGGGFSPKAAYIFRKQLEEADVVVINRMDELWPRPRPRSCRASSPGIIPACRCCASRPRPVTGFEASDGIAGPGRQFWPQDPRHRLRHLRRRRSRARLAQCQRAGRPRSRSIWMRS